MKRRFIAMIVCFALLLTTLPGTALAAVNDLIGNSAGENQEILNQLADLTGMDAQQIAERLKGLGLLDENGEIKTDYTISLNGEELTLEEATTLLEDPATDLSQIGYVDGTPIALGDLKTIIEIEKELARIQETYFSGKTFSGESLENLNGLMNQLQTEGISLMGEENISLMAENADLPILDVSNFTELDITGGGTPSISSDTFVIPAKETVSFDVRFIPAYSCMEFKSISVYLADAQNNKLANTTLTMPGWPTEDILTGSLAFENTKTEAYTGVRIVVSAVIYETESRMSGHITSVLEFSNAKGIVFKNSGAYTDNHTIKLMKYFMQNLETTETIGRNESTWNGTSLQEPVRFPAIPSQRLNNLIVSMQCADGYVSIGNGDEDIAVHYHFKGEFSQTNSAGIATRTDTYINYGVQDFRRIEIQQDISGKALAPGEKYTLEFTGWGNRIAIPQSLTLENAFDTSVGGPALNWITGVLEGGTISLIDDETSPVLQNVKTTEGTYYFGQSVYVELDFDEMVKIDENAIITANGKNFKASELSAAFSGDGVYFWYPVQPTDGEKLTISISSGITDLFGNGVEISGQTVEGANLKAALMRNAAKGIQGSYGEDEKASFTLTLDETEAYKTKYVDYGSGTNPQELPFRIVLYKPDGSELTTQQFYVSDDGKTYQTQSFGIEKELDEVAYTARLQANEGTIAEPDWVDVYWVNTSITVPAFVPVNKVTVKPESEEKNYTLSLGESYRPTLSAECANDSGKTPTITSGQWSSSNPEIAAIDPNTGAVTLTGTSIGEVTFTFTADNGGKAEAVSGSSAVYTVIAGDSIALVIPTGSSTIISRQNAPATVLWSSNASYFVEDKDFKFRIDLYEGNYGSEADLENVAALKTYEAEMEANSITIDEGVLSKLSEENTPAYTVRVSMPHPNAQDDSVRLSAMVWIVVRPKPAAAKLVRPEKTSLTDETDSIEIPWILEDWTEGSGQTAELNIIQVAEDNRVINTITEPISAAEGSYVLSLSDLGEEELKHTYQVMLTLYNVGGDAPSQDSYPLYVYNGDVLHLVNSENQEIDHLTMNNIGKVDGSSGPLPTDTQGIQKLRQQLNLMDYVGINYQDYSWNAFKDGISWESGNDEIAAINYKQGGLYENIKNFSYSSYLPQTQMGISSTASGETTITATHAATGMSATLTVQSSTLKDKFYFFQVDPAIETTLEYVDGAGNQRIFNTNGDGTLALYEPNGIGSDVWLRSQEGDTLYLGTIYQWNIASGERDAAKLQLYPINNISLREVAKAKLTLSKPGGDPLSDTDITIRGGVYKNGYYCETAKLGPDADSLKEGGIGQTYHTDANGTVTVYFDSSQFWSKENGENEQAVLVSTDKIEYIFEISEISGNQYYPLLHTANASVGMIEGVRMAEGVITLEEVAAGEQNKPFVAFQKVDYGRLQDVRKFNGRIGPSSSYKEAELQTVMYLWGETMEGVESYELKMVDENGYIPASQSSSVEPYPFSSIPIVSNKLTLTEESMTNTGWIPDGTDMGLKTRLSKGKDLVQERVMPFRLIDLSRVPEVNEDDDVSNVLVTMKEASQAKASDFGEQGGSSILKTLSGKLSDINGPVDSSVFKMIISPSEDPTVFKALIWTGYNTMDLDDMNYEENGIALDTNFLSSEAEIGVPGVGDLSEMAQGTYNPAETYRQNASKSSFKGTDLNLQLEGFYEAEIRYNLAKKKWEVYTVAGGFTAGAGMAFNFNINTMVGPVPVTASFEVGGAIQLDFKTAVRYSQQGSELAWSDPNLSAVNDYLTTLRINAYAEAFGGVGFDYSVVAFKFGVFGKLTVDNQNKFLSRTYLADASKRQLNGQALGITGEAGIKFVAKFLFISYDAVLASGSFGATKTFNSWGEIDNYWGSATSGLSLMELQSEAEGSGLNVVSASATLQSRNYLEQYARSWGEGDRVDLFSLDEENRLENLQSNANPGAYPEISDDGKVLVHISDQNSTSIYDSQIQYSRLENGSYSEPMPVPDPSGFEGFGDSDADIAGEENFAAAAWVRMRSEIPEKDAGDAVNAEEQHLLMNSSEVVASVYDGTQWKSTQLTNNGSPDLAPAVTANNGKAVVFWRNVYSSGEENLLNFKSQDAIMYRSYDGSRWSEAKQLYNGAGGSVKALEAAMLPDGTAIAVYTLDKSENGNTDEYEVGYTLVKNDGSLGTAMMLTADQNLDENPQVISAQFAEGDDRFVIGWHSVKEGESDIQMAAVSADGVISNSFPASLTELTSTDSANVGADFRFATLNSSHRGIENLSILWNENVSDETDSNGLRVSAHSEIKAARLRSDGNGGYVLSGALELAKLPENNLTDHFAGYVSGKDEVKAVIQTTAYDNKNLVDMGGVFVPGEKAMLYTATSGFADNAAEVESIGVEYQQLRRNSWTTLQFSVRNTGINDLSGVTVDLGNGETGELSESLLPNQSAVVPVLHKIGETIEDIEYTVTANEGAVQLNGTVYLDYPDIGISRMEVLKEEEGKRTIGMTLYNMSDAELAGKDRTVRIDLYTDDMYTEKAKISSNTAGVTVQENSLLITGEALERIDEDVFNVELTFDVKDYVINTLKETEIPKNGIYLYADVWTEGKIGSQSEKVRLPEYSSSDNQKAVLLTGALGRTGKKTELDVEQGSDANGNTTAKVTLQNNSLQDYTEGILIANLLDKDGQVLETQRTDISGTMSGEMKKTDEVSFSQAGARVTVDVLESNEDILSIEGLPITLDYFGVDEEGNYVCDYTLPSTYSGNKQFTAYAADGGKVVIAGKVLENGGSYSVKVTGRDQEIEFSIGEKNYVLHFIPSGDVKYSSQPAGGIGTTYTVSFDSQGGSAVSSQRISKNETASKPEDPSREGYVFAGWYTEAECMNAYDFSSKVTKNITLYAKWTEDMESVWENPFGDVQESDWYYENVKYAYENQLFAGISETEFGPNDVMTRGMLVTVLHRAEGEPQGEMSEFKDIPEGEYYAEAVNWAAANGIVNGYDENTFAPNDSITREQIAAILERYGDFKERATDETGDLSRFIDADQVSDWALENVKWAVGAGLINGHDDGRLDPLGNATRAEVAAMLQRFLEQ